MQVSKPGLERRERYNPGMSDMSTDLLEKALKLTVEERIQLVEEIWDTVAASPDSLPLTQAQIEELDRRMADLEVNPDAGRPWEEVRARLLGGS
jgi:putative addiction module component (TIGR02574 family)